MATSYAGSGEICQRVRDNHDRHMPVWGPYYRAMREERDFLAGDRYEDDNGSYRKDRRLTQIRGQEIADTIRHVVARTLERPRSIEARPIDRVDDADAAEIAAALLEWEITNPWKMFEDVLEEAVTAARESRLGVIWADYDPDLDEVLYRYADGMRFMWDPRYHPHHPKAPFLLEELRVTPEEVEERYGVKVKPDADAFNSSGTIRLGTPLLRGAGGQMLPDLKRNYDDGLSTIWKCWYKNDRTPGGERETPEGQRALEPGSRYMTCLGGCGYRTPPQDRLRNGARPVRLPRMLERGCPVCSGDLERIDAKQQVETVLRYPKGKRLVVMAPFQRIESADGADAPIYDGGWPLAGLRSFPGCFVTCGKRPGMPLGPSDTYRMWDEQVASDQLATLGLQRVFQHQNYWIMPAVGINDAQGFRFEFRDDQYNVMYRDAAQTEFGPLDVQQVSGIGLDPAFGLVSQLIDNKLTRYRGVQDFDLTPQNSKDIAASTVAQLTQLADVQIEQFKREVKREVSRFAGVVWDMLRETVTAQKLSRLRIEGVDRVVALAGDDMPGYDFVIEDTPDFTGVDEQKSKALGAMMTAASQASQLGLDPQQVVSLYAELNNLPRSVVRKFQAVMQQAKDKAEAKSQGGADAGGIPPEVLDQLGAGAQAQMPQQAA